MIVKPVMPNRLFITIASIVCGCVWLFVSLNVIGEEKTLRVGIPTDGYPPFIIHQGDSVTGILIEPLALATAKRGISLQFHFLPEKRSQVLLDNHGIDARMESPQWIDNPDDYLWSEAITQLDDVFVYKKGTPNHYESDEQLQGAEIITHLGYGYPTLQPLFDAEQAIRIDYVGETQMLKGLLRTEKQDKRAAVMSKDVAKWLIKSDPRLQNQFAFSQRVIGSAPLMLQFRNDDAIAELLDGINRDLKQFKSDGTIERIIEQTLTIQ